MLEGSNACGLTKEEEETYVSASQCVSPIPSILDNRDHFTRAQIQTLSFVFVSPNCASLLRPKGDGKEKGGDVCLRHSPILRLQLFETLMMCLFFFIFCCSTKLSCFFSWQLTICDLVKANSRVCQLSSGLGRGGCSRTRHIYSIVPNLTGSDA